MNVNKKNIGLNNGWILCPSKSFPGKFYYFNVLNGEAAWSLNDVDKKGFRKDNPIHKIADNYHNYPEPTTLPDDTSMVSYKVGANIKQPDCPKNILNQSLPMFGQAAFHKYVGNADPLMPNIVWTPVQLPMPMFCQESKKPMSDKITQTSDIERDLFIKTGEIPLCKRFRNYEKPSISFNEKNKIVNRPVNIFQTSTPKSYVFDKKPETQNCTPKSKCLMREPVFKLDPKLPSSSKMPDLQENSGKPTVRPCDKVESTVTDRVPKLEKGKKVLEKLHKTDLRFLLLAKRRKSVDAMVDAAIERKRSRPSEVNHMTSKKKVTFDLAHQTEDDSVIDDMNAEPDYNPITPNHTRNTIDTPKTPITKDKFQSPSINKTSMEFPKDWPTLKLKKQAMSMARTDVWYIVADTDVLLLDYELIDNIVLSDNKCKLLIPNAVRMDIEGLCIGDCRGQQRVINARQLTRRLATPPKHYTVEHIPADKDNIAVTSQSILNCCIQAINANYHVVLITNDPHLQSIANSLNIPSYKLNEIKNGVNIKPAMMTSDNKFEFRNSIDDTDKNNPFLQNESSFGLFSDLNTCPYMTNLSPVDMVKKQLFFNSDMETENTLDYDKLINITKPKSMKNNENMNKYDSDSTSDISTDVQHLNLKDKHALRPCNLNRNSLLHQNVNKKNIKAKEDEYISLEKNIQNSNTTFNDLKFEKSIPKPKFDLDFENSVLTQLNRDIHNYQNESLKKNADSTEKLFCYVPNSNMKQSHFPNSHFEKVPNINPLEVSGISINNKMPNMNISLWQEPCGTSRESRILNAKQARIKKIFSSINCDSTTNNQQESQTKTNDVTGLFKVPQPVQSKTRTKHTSALVERAPTTDQIGRSWVKNTDSIDEFLNSFRVKSKITAKTISCRIDEWICSFTQIVEDVLNNLLQKNTECMKNTAAPLTLHDTLNCIKMLYDSHTKIREIVDNLEDLLNKCLCVKGKLKYSLRPDDFMTMFGYGVLLVLSLQNILPLSEDLKEAESCLSSLLYTMENTSTELDPDLFKSLVVSRSDVDSEDDEKRPNFVKESSYIIDYLKKHFKEWATYEEHLEGRYNMNKQHYYADVTVLRTHGKNLNLLKINSTKTISLTTNKAEEGLIGDEEPKIIKIIDNNNINNNNYVNIDTNDKNEAGPKLTKLPHNDQNIYLINNHTINEKYNTNNFIIDNELKIDQEKDVQKLTKPIQNIDPHVGNETKIIDNADFPPHGNTFTQIEETAGPKMIRNIKLIDEYEKKIQNREPLDLDLLDYSEIYEPSVTENLQFDVLCGNEVKENDKIDENLKNNNDNFGLSNERCTLEDFSKDENLGNRDEFYAIPSYDYEPNNGQSQEMVTEPAENTNKIDQIEDYYNITDTETVRNLNFAENTDKANCGTKLDLDNKNLSQKDSCIDTDNSYTINDNSELHNGNSGLHNDNSRSHNDNAELPDTNSKLHNDNFDRTAQNLRDDITNDSGFENDSTYAHSVVKIFLNELSTSFIVIYQFVTKFINEIRNTNVCELKMNALHNQASKSLEDMVAIIEKLRSIIKRESTEESVLKTLLLKAGVEVTTDKRMTRYRQIVMKSLEQAQLLENTLRIIVSTTIGDFDALSTNAVSIDSCIRYFNIFE